MLPRWLTFCGIDQEVRIGTGSRLRLIEKDAPYDCGYLQPIDVSSSLCTAAVEPPLRRCKFARAGRIIFVDSSGPLSAPACQLDRNRLADLNPAFSVSRSDRINFSVSTSDRINFF
jgi:hypothetical protein